jgi:hypothetical protein
MMPLEQTTINRTPSTSNNKNNTQDEPEIRTNYTWQGVKKRKRSNQSPETIIEGNPFLFNTQNRYEELSRLSDEDMQKTRQVKHKQTPKINHEENLNPLPKHSQMK